MLSMDNMYFVDKVLFSRLKSKFGYPDYVNIVKSLLTPLTSFLPFYGQQKSIFKN